MINSKTNKKSSNMLHYLLDLLVQFQEIDLSDLCQRNGLLTSGSKQQLFDRINAIYDYSNSNNRKQLVDSILSKSVELNFITHNFVQEVTATLNYWLPTASVVLQNGNELIEYNDWFEYNDNDDHDDDGDHDFGYLIQNNSA